jgi:uncharacterized protein YndB with AHSA1/START domain
MTTAHIYQVYIQAPIERVFAALVDPEFTRQYFHGTAFQDPPIAGEPFLTTLPDGRPAIDGVIEVHEPPHRLVHTWRVRYDDAMAAEPPSRVEWLLAEAGPDLTRVRLTHSDLARSPLTWANVKDGWVWIVDSLKTLLETGMPLPPVSEDVAEAAGAASSAAAADSTADITADWHRAQAVEINNAVWDQLDAVKAGTAGITGLVRGAYAAAYHWERARGAAPANEARARYLIGKAWLASGRPDQALDYGNRTLAQCEEHGLGDFDLAYAHELRARGLAGLGRHTEAAQAWATARAVTAYWLVVTDIAADRARLLEIVKAKAIVHGRVTLSSGGRRTTTSTCAGSPSTARPRPWSGGSCASSPATWSSTPWAG